LERMEQAHVVYRYQAPEPTIRSSNAFGILIVIFPFPSLSTKAS